MKLGRDGCRAAGGPRGSCPGCLGLCGVVPDTYPMRVINIIGINCLLALGLNLVIGVAGQLDAGQAGFFAVGAYTAGILGVTFGVPFWVTVFWPRPRPG